MVPEAETIVSLLDTIIKETRIAAAAADTTARTMIAEDRTGMTKEVAVVAVIATMNAEDATIKRAKKPRRRDQEERMTVIVLTIVAARTTGVVMRIGVAPMIVDAAMTAVAPTIVSVAGRI